MKFFKLLIIFQIVLFFNSCSTMKDGFSNQKKDNTDEFLVKKKSPLVMPPDYDELPTPKKENGQIENTNKVKKLITQNNGNSSIENNQNLNDSIENFVLDKIKSN